MGGLRCPSLVVGIAGVCTLEDLRMRKSFLVAVAGLTLVANVANGGLFNLRARLVSKTEVENSDPSAAVLRVTEGYRGRVAQAEPTPADLPPMASPKTGMCEPPSMVHSSTSAPASQLP